MKFAVCTLLVTLMLSGCASRETKNTAEQAKPQTAALHVSLNAGDELSAQNGQGHDFINAADSVDGIFLDDSAFDDGMAFNSPIPDPLEPWNRMWFSFNDVLLLHVIKPVYQGYDAITPDALQSGLSNALRNLQAPIRIVNSILQFEFAQAVVEFGRFVVNTTAGGLGLAEIVKPEAALVPINLETANFSGTLAKWGVGEGIYLVWPLIGPSTLRDTVGVAGDWASSLSFWSSEPIGMINMWTSYGTSGALRFNSMGTVISGYETLKKSSIEPYTALRNAYVSLRRSQSVKAFPVARPAS